MIELGADLGSYRVLSLLGEGGMGLVYLAEHKALERRVAIKVLRPECGRDPSNVARFFTEARSVNRIGHEHIVDVTDLGVTPDGETYIVMEYLIGESLDTRLKRDGSWPMERALHMAIQVADALAASHTVGIIHRDLKPENIYLIQRSGERDYVKVLDFGLAKLVGDAMQEGLAAKTQAGTVIGTPQYMAPEQAFGKPVDSRADVYSLGVILYQLVTGKLPFQADNAMGMLLQHATKPPPSLRELLPDVPEALDVLVRKSMAKNKEQRHTDMAEMRDALIHLQGQPYDIAATTQMPAISDEHEALMAGGLMDRDGPTMITSEAEERTRIEPPPSEALARPPLSLPVATPSSPSGVRLQVSAASRTWAANPSGAASTAAPPPAKSTRWINPPPTNPSSAVPQPSRPEPPRIRTLPPPATIARPKPATSSRWLAMLGGLVVTLVIILLVTQLSRGAPQVQPAATPLPTSLQPLTAPVPRMVAAPPMAAAPHPVPGVTPRTQVPVAPVAPHPVRVVPAPTPLPPPGPKAPTQVPAPTPR